MSRMPGALAASRALPLALAVLLCLLVAMTALGVARMGSMEQRLSELSDSERLKTALFSSLLKNIHERSRVVRESYALPGAKGSRTRYERLAHDYDRDLARWRTLGRSDSERSRLASAERARAAARALHREVLARASAGEVEAARALYGARAELLESDWEDALYGVLEASGAAAMGVVDEARSATRQNLFTLAGVGTALLALGALVAVAVTRKVRRAESELEREKELAQVTLHSIGDGVITTDADGRVEYLNPVAEKYTGWRNDDARARRLGEIYRIVDERSGAEVDPMAVHPQDGGQPEDEDRDDRGVAVRLLHRDGRACPIRYSHAPIHGRDGRRLGTILVFHDVSRIRAMAQQLLWQASHDALTGLVNRREFERRLAELAATAH